MLGLVAANMLLFDHSEVIFTMMPGCFFLKKFIHFIQQGHMKLIESDCKTFLMLRKIYVFK